MSEVLEMSDMIERRPSRLTWWLHPKVATPLMLLAILLLSPFLVRGYRLSKLPDIGDPFDVDALLKTFPPVDDQVEKLLVKASSHRRAPTRTEHLLIDFDESGWTTASEPLRAWPADNEIALDEWTRAIEFPQWPKGTDLLSVMDSVEAKRDLAQLLQTRAECSLYDGDAVGAWNTTQSLLRMQSLVADNAGGLDRMCSTYFAHIAFETAERIMATSHFSADQLRAALCDLQKIRSQLPPKSAAYQWDYVRDVRRRWHFDDPGIINLLQSDFAPEELKSVPIPLRAKTLWLFGDPDYSHRATKICLCNWLEEINKPRHLRATVIGAPVPLFETSSDPRLKYLSQKINERYLSRHSLSRGLELVDVLDRSDAFFAAIELVAACQLHHRLHGEFPAILSALVPDILLKLPTDPFSKTGETLQYRRDGESAVIYSLGIDEMDDGGLTGRRLMTDKRDDGYRIKAPTR